MTPPDSSSSPADFAREIDAAAARTLSAAQGRLHAALQCRCQHPGQVTITFQRDEVIALTATLMLMGIHEPAAPNVVPFLLPLACPN